jgi:hypothetical protein
MAYRQWGAGYQSRAGPPLGPGDEGLIVVQPQLEAVLRQSDDIRHRIWVPVDLSTAASPDAVDAVSRASWQNKAASLDWTATVRTSRGNEHFVRAGFHLEEQARSWLAGAGFVRSFADDNTAFAANVLQVFDGFDRYALDGKRLGHTFRSTTSGSVSLSQVLSPTTVANVNYGLTGQMGELSNTWNAVPTASGYVQELLADLRLRHALVGRLSQYLPWDGALRAYYRFYADDWGAIGHTVEAQLAQRLSEGLVLEAVARGHRQSSVAFFTTRAPVDPPAASPRTADSDLAQFDAFTVGGHLRWAVALGASPRVLDAHVGLERYERTNGLVTILSTCGLGVIF